MHPINSTRGGVGFLREGREWETLAILNYSASGENMKLMPLNNASWQGLSSHPPLSASLQLSARAESGEVSRDENGFRNEEVMLREHEFSILDRRGCRSLRTLRLAICNTSSVSLRLTPSPGGEGMSAVAPSCLSLRAGGCRGLPAVVRLVEDMVEYLDRRG